VREPTTYCFAGYEFDEPRGELRREGRRVEILPKPFAVLHYLVRNRDRLVPKNELLDALWPEITVSDSALSSAIKQIRHVLCDDGTSQQFVRTLRGRGYRFVAPVQESRAPLDRPVTEAAPPIEGMQRGDVFVGRRRDLRRLVYRLESARRGRGGLVLVSGEAGIGKTRLLDRLAAIARARSVPLHRAWCYEGEGVPPLWPWEQVLAGLGEDLGRRLESADARNRFRLFESISRVVRRLGEEKEGLLLLFDDLQWADSASLQLLEFLMRDLPSSALLVVGAFREPLPDREHPLTAALAACARYDGCEHIVLQGLDRAEVAELL